MKRILYVVAVGLGLGASVFAGTRLLSQPPPPPVPAAPAVYNTEQEWIVSDIANAILNVAAFARHESGPTPVASVTDLHIAPGVSLAKFRIEAGAQYSIDVTQHLWAPDPFIPLARQALGPTPGVEVPDDGGALRSALTDPRPEIIQSHNTRISARLRSDPRSPALHEQAALVLGALALRENAAILSDPRRMMSRMTAHLAVARALDINPPTLDGELAAAVLLALANRQSAALARLTIIEAADKSPAVAAWTRALRVRVTKDWRLVPDVSAATLLEQREAVRAAHLAVGNTRSLATFDKVSRKQLSDWGRAMFHQSPSVETGHLFAETTITAELDEAAAVRRSFPGSANFSDAATVVRELNIEPSSGPATFEAERQFWVIDWGTWAAASQRHVAAGLVCTSRHLRKMLGLPEQASAVDRTYQTAFGGLRLFPLVAREIATDGTDAAEYTRAAGAAGELARTRPDLMTDSVWTGLHRKPAFAAVPPGVPPSDQWFAPRFPAGTAFDPRRVYTANYQVRVDPATLAALRQMAPHEGTFVLRAVDQQYGAAASLETLQKELGALAGYDLSAAWKIARAAMPVPDVYVPIVRRIAETMNPDDWYWVAEYLADHDRNAEAEAAFERYRREGRDQVSAANRSEWFVIQLFRAGQRARALTVARSAAEVYSYGGLITYGEALDLSGDPARAETFYRQALERYGHHERDLLAFLIRHQAGNPAYTREAQSLAPKVFPAGFEPVTAGALSGAPDAGMQIERVGVRGAANGLRAGDVIVAVDGVRIRNIDQYAVQKYRSWQPEMRFVVWREGRYLEIPTTLRHRWVVNTLRPFPKPADAH